MKDPKIFSDVSKAELVLREEDCIQMPDLLEYLDNLRSRFEVGKDGNYEYLLKELEQLDKTQNKGLNKIFLEY